MVVEMCPVGGFLLVLLTCTSAQSQTVPPPDSVQPAANGTIVFFRQGENGYYGNNVTVRTSSLSDSANKAWYDEATILPNGTLMKFYMMAPSYSQLDDASTRIRLQIWRPVDLVAYKLMLVWQQLVQVAAVAPIPLVYTYTINQNVTLVAGDRIGWAFEGRAGPISFEYAESHRTRLQSSKVTALPEVGQVVEFDPVYLPSIFSIAVSVDDRPQGSTEPHGHTGGAGATGQRGCYYCYWTIITVFITILLK